jgi:ATP-dependent Clp protease protease subunit
MINMGLVPMVIDHSTMGERAYDIYSLLLKERIIFLSGPINDAMAGLLVAQLLYLNSVESHRPVHLYIQSPGGIVYSGFAIYDTMRSMACPVYTYAVGFTGSMATFLLSAGVKRFALPHATVHMHPTGGGAQGYTEDVRIATREQERLQTQLFHLMGQHTGHSWEELETFFLRDKYLNAQEALEFGLIDEVMGDSSQLLKVESRTPLVHFTKKQKK